MCLPSLQTVNVFPPLLSAFLGRALVADFPPDLLQNSLFRLVREMKRMRGRGQDPMQKKGIREAKTGLEESGGDATGSGCLD